MCTPQPLSASGDVAQQLLQAVVGTENVLTSAVPPFSTLKDIAITALGVHLLVQGLRHRKKLWNELGTYARDATASVVHSFGQNETLPEDINEKLTKLKAVLDEIHNEVKKEADRPRYLFGGVNDPDAIDDLRRRLDDAIGLFQLSTMVAQMNDVSQILTTVIDNGKAQATAAKTTALMLNATLDRLARVPGSSWDSHREYMPDTRVRLLNYLQAWGASYERTGSDGDSTGGCIVLLTAVAGGGKTTVAHVAARRWHEEKLLGSSFFFDRETAGRNSTVALFATIAADLGSKYPMIGERIATAIEADHSLLSAPVSRQFDQLVLEPCKSYSFTGPVVAVIDALDEAWDESLLEVLRTGVPQLPGAFRVFVTSRMRPELDRLVHMPHVTRIELDITEHANLEDTQKYAHQKILQLAQYHSLGIDWPGDALRRQFVDRAGGLFLWVRVVCEYLDRCDDPTGELDDLLGASATGAAIADESMDTLYEKILAGCNWSDKSFVAAYQRVMGTAIASKTPLSILAMRELYHNQPLASERTLHRLSPLMAGMTEGLSGAQPVRVLHQSLRDFLVDRTARTQSGAQYLISERDHSRTLGLLCIQLVCRELHEGIHFTGYLATDEQECPGIPTLAPYEISEPLQYACRYWLEHVRGAERDRNIMKDLDLLMGSKGVPWLELATVVGQCPSPHIVRNWVKVSANTQRLVQHDSCVSKESIDIGQATAWINADYADACVSLSSRLAYEDRREEALEYTLAAVATYRELADEDSAEHEPKLASSLNDLYMRLSGLGYQEKALVATEEAVRLYRTLAAERPTEFNTDLATCLNNLSVGLSDLGRREEALTVIQEAVELYPESASEQTTTLTPNLAMSLTNLALRLSGLGRREEALVPIQEAVGLYRRLAADRPAVFTSSLAASLSAQSVRLSSLGRREEALAVIKEAVELYRSLATVRPVGLIPDLAGSLNNFSNLLCDLGRSEEALPPIKETVDLYRRLVTGRPAAFTHDLARSLNNMAVCLSPLGRREEALAATQEAVELRRRLAAERPAAFTSDLAMSLNNLSSDLAYLGRREEALETIREAVELYRRLAADRPAVFSPNLAMSLFNSSARLSDLEHHHEALPEVQEAVQLYRHLAQDLPTVYDSDLADSLNRLSLILATLGRAEEAETTAREARQVTE